MQNFKIEQMRIKIKLIFNSRMSTGALEHAMATIISGSTRLAKLAVSKDVSLSIHNGIVLLPVDEQIEMLSHAEADISLYEGPDERLELWKGDTEAAFYSAAKAYNEALLREAAGYGLKTGAAVQVNNERYVRELRTEYGGKVTVRSVYMPGIAELKEFYGI